jgi:ATPase subunit of ABC transporter with duplicated ATPase domains
VDHPFLSFNSVEYSYPSSVYPILRNITLDLHQGWTGIAGENGAGKNTLLLLAAGILQPNAGSIKRPGGLLYCPQRTDDIPEGWEDFFSSPDSGVLCGRLGIEYDWPYRWDSLSHGERKRLQLAIALVSNPAVLAVDEPTNHPDGEAKKLIGDALAGYTGIGLLVSHDRALLDRLCHRCLFLEAGGAVLRPGGVSQGLAEDERKRLASEADKRRQLADSSVTRLSKKKTRAKDHDAGQK